MPPIVIDVRQAEDSRDVVHRAVQALVEGHLAVFPTETVYGVAASALQADAVARLSLVKGRPSDRPLTLAIKSAEDAWDYVPHVSGIGRRLARRCWPGPVTLVFENNHPDSLLRCLPQSVQQAVCPQGTVGLRVPAHQLILDVLDLLAGPIVLSSANLTGEPAATTAQQVIASLGDRVELVLDDGQSRYGEASSVVKVTHEGMEMLRAGVVSESTMQRLATYLIVIVCTGNTCRSPMAEALFRQQLAAKMACSIDQLEDHGILVMSAGIAAVSGARASRESVEIMQQWQLNLTDHVSQPVTDRLVRHADRIFTMTNGHLAGLLAQWPEAVDRTQLLCPHGHDVTDPIGGPLELYEKCAHQIDEAVRARVVELDLCEICPRPAQ